MQSAHAPRAARAAAAGASNSVDGTVGKPSARLAFAASKRSFKRLLEGSRDRAYSRFPTLSFLRLLKNSFLQHGKQKDDPMFHN